MDWFRPALSSILLLALTLGLFFWPVSGAYLEWLEGASLATLWAFTLARIALLLAAGYGLSRASSGGATDPARVATLIAAPTVLVGGAMGVMAALQPHHLAIVAGLALAVAGACWLGARRGARA